MFTLNGTYPELATLLNGVAWGREDKFLEEFREWLLENGATPTNAPYFVLVLYGSGISLRPAEPLTDEQQGTAKLVLLTRLQEFLATRSAPKQPCDE